MQATWKFSLQRHMLLEMARPRTDQICFHVPYVRNVSSLWTMWSRLKWNKMLFAVNGHLYQREYKVSIPSACALVCPHLSESPLRGDSVTKCQIPRPDGTRARRYIYIYTTSMVQREGGAMQCKQACASCTRFWQQRLYGIVSRDQNWPCSSQIEFPM